MGYSQGKIGSLYSIEKTSFLKYTTERCWTCKTPLKEWCVIKIKSTTNKIKNSSEK
jgi:hypothetical protein